MVMKKMPRNGGVFYPGGWGGFPRHKCLWGIRSRFCDAKTAFVLRTH